MALLCVVRRQRLSPLVGRRRGVVGVYVPAARRVDRRADHELYSRPHAGLRIVDQHRAKTSVCKAVCVRVCADDGIQLAGPGVIVASLCGDQYHAGAVLSGKPLHAHTDAGLECGVDHQRHYLAGVACFVGGVHCGGAESQNNIETKAITLLNIPDFTGKDSEI